MSSHYLLSMHHVKSESFTNTYTPKHYISTIFDYPQNLVVIDSKVDHLQRLITGVIPHAIIVVLNSQQDSIEQLTEAIRKYHYCTTLHLVSHGYPGGITVGNTQLNIETLNQYSSSLQQWNLDLILLYGCQVAAGDSGTEFIQQLHDLTGANIAASATKTGNAALGGDWNLEVNTGQAEIDLAFKPEVLQSYQGIFAVTLDLNGTDSGEDYSATYTEEGDPTIIADTDATLTATTDVQSATIILTNALDGDLLTVGTLPTGITSNVDTSVDGEITVTLTGNATASQYQEILRGDISFVNLLNNPDTTTNRNIEVTVTGTDTSNATATTTIAVTAVNDAPVVDLDGDDSSEFTEDTTTTTPEQITGAISDGNGSGTFTLERTAVNGFTDTVDFIDGVSGIEARNNVVQGNTLADRDQFTYTFSVASTDSSISEVQVFQTAYTTGGTTEAAEYIFDWIGEQAVLNDPNNQFSSHADGALISPGEVLTFGLGIDYRTNNTENLWRLDVPAESVTVAMTSNNPNPDPDLKDQVFNEWISFDAVFHPEPDYLTSFTERGSAVAIADTDATVTDIDGSNIESATIVLTNAFTDDDLIIDETALPTGISLDNKDTSVPGQITITLTGTASLSDYQTALQQITFNNSSNALDTTDRIIEVTVNDGEATSPTATTTITINPINDGPPVASSNAITVNEASVDTPLGLTQATDIDNDPLTITVTGLPTLGTVTKADGTIVNDGDTLTNTELEGLIYDAPTDYNGTDDPGDFTYNVTDGTETVAGSVDITINPADNNNPVASDNTITVDVGSNDSDLGLTVPTDIDGDTLTITITELPSLGTVTTSDGTPISIGDTLTNTELTELIYDAPTDYNGTDDPGDFSYDVTDGNGGEDTGSVDITINPADNNNPVASDNTITVDVGSNDSDLGLTVPTDIDGDTLTITITELPSLGTVTTSDGTPISIGDTLTNTELTELIYDAPTDYNGTDDPGDFSYDVTDGNGGSDTGSVDITIKNNPNAVDDNIGTTKDTAVTIDVLADNGNGEDSDPDNDPLTVTQINGTDINPGDVITLPSGALLTFNTDGTFSYDPNNQFESLTGTTTDTDSFNYTITDGNNTSEATVTVTIAGENSPPIAEDDADSTDANTVLTGNVLTDNGNGVDRDPDNNQITVNRINNEAVNMGQPMILDSGAEIILNPDGTFSYNPNGQFDNLGVGETATDTFTYTINDGIADSTDATVTITINGVNDDPVATEDNLQTSPQRPLTFDPLTNDTDPDGDNLTLQSIDTPPDNGQIVQNPDGTLTYIPDPTFTGTDSFTYTVNDGNGGTSTATVNIEVNPDNDGDGILDVDDLDDDNDGIPDSEEGTGDTDGDGVPDIFDLDSDNDGISDLNESGLSPEKIAELDTDNDGVIDTPVGDNGLADDIETIPESGELDLDGDGEADDQVDTDSDGVPDIRDLDSDSDGILDVTEVGNPDADGDGVVDGEDSDGNGLIDTVDPNNDNPLTIPPDSDNDGVPDIRDLDSDNDGIHDIIEGGLDDTDNDGIVGGSDSDGDGIADSIDNNDGFGNVNQSFPLDSDRDNIPDYLDLDSDDDGINDITEVGLADPDGDGRLESNDVDGDGIADAVDQNNDGFGDNAAVDLPDSDGDGIPDFRDVNNSPIATDDNANIAANTPVTIAALDNDTDADNDPLNIDSFDSTSTNGGNIIVDGNNFIYTPADSFTGVDTFTYTISDSKGGTSTATITITVEDNIAVDNNNIPVAGNDTETTPANTPVTIAALDNDTDADNDPLNIDSFDSTSTNGGNIIVDGDNFIYTPADGFSGVDTFTYTISDGNGGTSTATITITVENSVPVDNDNIPVDNNNIPIATDDNINTPVNTPITVDILENDSDPNGDRITIDQFDSTSSNGGTVSLDQDQLVYTPPADFSGIDTFTYTITDDNGGSDTAIVTVNIDNPTTPEDKDCDCPELPTINPISLPIQPQVEALMFPEIGNSNNATILGSNNNDNLTATNADDFVDAAAGDDEIILLDGNDTLLAGDGDDLTYAGSGNDLLFGNNGNDFLKGDSGNDTIIGSPSGNQPIGNIGEQDHLFGDDGDDWLGGNLGDDTLHGGVGSDRIHGGKDNDHMLGEIGNDTLWGEQGDDVLLGGTSNVTVEDVNGRDLLFGGEGNDTLYGNQNLDTLVAGDGDDQLHGGQGNDLLYGNTGDDIFFGEFGNDTIIGGPSGDQPLGETGDRDLVFGDAGNDWIVGNLGRDSLYAGKGSDRLHGGKDDDWLLGELGDDTLNGEQGDDTILGGTSNDPEDPTRDVNGQDLLFGEAGNDFMDGNEGNDTLVAGDGNDMAYGGKDDDYIFGNAGNDMLFGDKGNDTLCGNEGNDTLRGDQIDDGNSPAVGNNSQQDYLSGGKGNDLLYGDEGQDTLCGDMGNDTLHGGKDNDLVQGCFGDNLLLGEMGDDTLVGGEGNDTLTGGDGNDTFVINPNLGNNLITDFQIGQDRLMLEGINFNQLQITQDSNSTVISFNNQVLATLDQVNAIDIDLNQFI